MAEYRNIEVPSGKRISVRGSVITVPFRISGRSLDDYNAVSIVILDKEFTLQNTNGASLLSYKSYELTDEVKAASSIAF